MKKFSKIMSLTLAFMTGLLLYPPISAFAQPTPDPNVQDITSLPGSSVITFIPGIHPKDAIAAMIAHTGVKIKNPRGVGEGHRFVVLAETDEMGNPYMAIFYFDATSDSIEKAVQIKLPEPKTTVL